MSEPSHILWRNLVTGELVGMPVGTHPKASRGPWERVTPDALNETPTPPPATPEPEPWPLEASAKDPKPAPTPAAKPAGRHGKR